MKNDLIQKLRDLRATRLSEYGNVAYQRRSNDWGLENVPEQLKKIWYGEDMLIEEYPNFIKLSKNSQIEYMTHDELECLIEMEIKIIDMLENIFSDLKNKESRYINNGKN